MKFFLDFWKDFKEISLFMFTSSLNKRIQSQICMKPCLIRRNTQGAYCESYVKANHLTKFFPLLNLEDSKFIRTACEILLLIIISCPGLLLTDTLFVMTLLHLIYS